MKQSDIDSSLFHVYRMFPLLATVFQNRVATIHSVAQNKNKTKNEQTTIWARQRKKLQNQFLRFWSEI